MTLTLFNTMFLGFQEYPLSRHQKDLHTFSRFRTANPLEAV